MTTYLLITAVVIFACVFLSKVSSRLGIPMLLAFHFAWNAVWFGWDFKDSV